jgi:predicted O-methyltransferase YrrM
MRLFIRILAHMQALTLSRLGRTNTVTTLTTPACATVVAKLFADADASDSTLHAQRDALSPQEQARFMVGAENYRAFYGRLKEFYLAVSRETATLIYMLARSCRATAIVEFGTSFGVSTVHLAAALRDNGGGRLLSSEFEPTKVAQARENLALAGLADLVEIRSGDALETLSRDLPEEIDFVLLDGAKGLYPKILSLLEPRLRSGALVVADNADWSPDYLARVRDSSQGYQSVAFASDVEVSLRL